MSRITSVELRVRDVLSGCPIVSKEEEVLATEESGDWTIMREKPRTNEEKGEGTTRGEAAIDWFKKNYGK